MKLQTKKKKVIIADDDAFYRRKISSILEDNGIASHVVCSGVDAVKAIIGDPEAYSCVLTDIHMDAMGGIEAASIIRRRVENVPIIIMTGDDSLSTEINARQVGISYYLKKPFGEKELLHVLSVFADKEETTGHVENTHR